jgi:uncharacterized protein (UPF0548 family)
MITWGEGLACLPVFVKPPPDRIITEFLKQRQGTTFSYSELGGTRGHDVPGYSNDHNRRHLGYGRDAYEKAKQALRRWAMFDMPWVHLCWPDTPIQENQTVAVMFRLMGVWFLNAARIVYVVDEKGGVERFGFAYGTLLDHVERGEERFTVEWHRVDDSVWYDIRAFSRPRWVLAKLAYPYARLMQRKFVRDSMESMRMKVSSPAG